MGQDDDRRIADISATIERPIRELSMITRRLRLMGPMILVVTLVNLGFFLWGLSRGGGTYFDYYPAAIALVNILVAMGCIAALGFFEALRKRGDALFQELSDELQWNVGRKWSDTVALRGNPRARPVLESRVALRTFSAAAELPLVPGQLGGAVYAFLNLLIATAAVTFLS